MGFVSQKAFMIWGFIPFLFLITHLEGWFLGYAVIYSLQQNHFQGKQQQKLNDKALQSEAVRPKHCNIKLEKNYETILPCDKLNYKCTFVV